MIQKIRGSSLNLNMSGPPSTVITESAPAHTPLHCHSANATGTLTPLATLHAVCVCTSSVCVRAVIAVSRRVRAKWYVYVYILSLWYTSTETKETNFLKSGQIHGMNYRNPDKFLGWIFEIQTNFWIIFHVHPDLNTNLTSSQNMIGLKISRLIGNQTFSFGSRTK